MAVAGLFLLNKFGYTKVMIWTVPNILTTGRLLAAPALALMFLYFNRPYADWFALLLFIFAALTDWVDGFLARTWKQETKFGQMLDPIADKAMVIIALLIIVGYSSMSPWLVLPATVILFREVFVSGLREFLGDSASTLQVTKLAKWKTTAQMAAIAILFSQGVFEHYLKLSAREIGPDALNNILNGGTQDTLGVIWKHHAMIWSGNVGLILLWVAAALTLITGFDYFKKALPFLKDEA